LIDRAAARFLRCDSGGVDFTRPAGEPALAAPDSVSWRVFKNPLALYVGGVAAVILELAEPRVRTGVWEHTSFRSDPLTRMRRTGLAAMTTVYGARSVAEPLIAGVSRMHGRVAGTTPAGQAYRADDPELLRWVQATAAYGFLEAYDRYVRPLAAEARNRFWSESGPAAGLYGASGSPLSEEDWAELLGSGLPRLEPSPIVFEFLALVERTAVLSPLLRPVRTRLVRAAVDIVPEPVRDRLRLNGRGLRPGEAALVRAAGAAADRVVIPSSPVAQACRRLGLPEDYVHRRR
jgi:uncharacterized protein (DUF2236 family)